MYVMITATYPLNKQTEVTGIFCNIIESPPKPPVKHLCTLARADLKSGMKVFTIMEVEEGKECEGIQAIQQSMIPYWSVEGYKYDIELMVDAVAWVQQQG